MLSAGWDSVIHVWDLRLGKSIKSIFGATVSGDSIDYRDNKILVGNHRNKDQVQIYDLSTGKLYKTIHHPAKDTPYVYSCQYSNFNNDILVGSSGAN